LHRVLTFFALIVALSACGPSASGPGAAVNDGGACALIAAPTAIFGKDAQVEPGARLDQVAGSCRFSSVDGRRGGEVLVMNASSLGAVTPQARLAEAFTRWQTLTHTPLAPVEGLGEEARIALDMSGYQTQIGFHKGESIVLVLGRSGDPKMDGEAIARALAAQAAQKAP
jgi:hypothetical protein